MKVGKIKQNLKKILKNKMQHSLVLNINLRKIIKRSNLPSILDSNKIKSQSIPRVTNKLQVYFRKDPLMLYWLEIVKIKVTGRKLIIMKTS